MSRDSRMSSGGRRGFLEAALGASAIALARSAHGGAGRGDGLDADASSPSGAASAMASALGTLVAALPADLRAKLEFPFAGGERYDWHFVPRPRKGVSLADLDPAQRERAQAALARGLGAAGYERVKTIVSLEDVLREMEGSSYRDPTLYFLRIFGEIGSRSPWGWSFEGHHVSLNYTVVGDRLSTTPLFLGAHPAEVRHGPLRGTRALGPLEDLARALLRSLDGTRRRDAVLSESAPRDILTGASRKATPLEPAGLAASRMTEAQAGMLMGLLESYAATMPADVARRRLETLRARGVGRIHFAWAGGAEPGEAHYYRLQGPSVLVEYDNIQNDADHIHSVWRDFDGDFGADLLAEHHRSAHRPA